ncbi:MAG: hypothetical protein OHK93_002711 [Ramalina farinacea]|uniref:Cytochrome P450 n=1 Tax=Ramalina farinacea TaxID=258253 RepID=A0AA43QS38_9LECA|nr:hypothetical protein [Ramalina farinacea]
MSHLISGTFVLEEWQAFNYCPLMLNLLALAILYALFQTAYNLLYHPLHRFPGPKCFAATPLPYVFASYSGCLATRLHKLHERYGPVVRTAPNELSFIDPSAWPTIYGRKNRSQQPFRKNYDSFNETRSQIRRSLYLANEEDHARARKLLNLAFSPEALRAQEPLLQGHVHELLNGIESETDVGPVDLEKWFTYFAFDVVGETSFGEPFNCVKEPSHRAWPRMLSRARKIITGISGLKLLVPSSIFCWMPVSQNSPLQRTVLQSVVNRLNFDLQKVEKRIVSKPDRGDVLSALIRVNEEKKALDNTEIMANAALFILAGTETVATLLCAVIYLLTQNSVALDRLTREMREVFQDESQLTLHNLSKMTYLTACIDEALRLVPPVPEGLPRVTPPEGESICGCWVAVQISTLAASWSTSNFVRPLSYEPERWLENKSSCYASDNMQASQPFSTGPRNCLGQSLALSEVRLVIANLIRKFDIECTMQKSWIEQPTYLLWEKKPLLVKLTPLQSFSTQ